MRLTVSLSRNGVIIALALPFPIAEGSLSRLLVKTKIVRILVIVILSESLGLRGHYRILIRLAPLESSP